LHDAGLRRELPLSLCKDKTFCFPQEGVEKMAAAKCCGGLGCMLGFYWFLEAVWAIYYLGAMFAIETGTDLAQGLVHQTAIGLSAFHFSMMGVVLYAMDTKARPQIALGFLVVIITDLTSTLHAAVHLWNTIPAYFFAFILNVTISSFGLCISLYALLWYFSHLYSELGRLESGNKYERLH